MGGCVASCMSSSDAGRQVDNKAAKKTMAITAFTLETDDPVEENASKIRRSPSQVKVPYTEWRGSFYDKYGSTANLLAEAVKTNGSKPGIAWRTLEKLQKEDVKQPNGTVKVMEVSHFAPRQTMSYDALWRDANAFGRGLVKLGMASGDLIGLYEETRPEWMIACLGLWTQGMVGVTVYANLGDDALLYALKEADLGLVICNGKQASKVVNLCKSGEARMPKIVYTDALPSGVSAAELQAVSFNDVVLSGGDEAPQFEFSKDSNQQALIMYTSGTTGDPKGVMISHGNVTAAVLGFERIITNALGTAMAPDDAYVAYLPLAHILEFAAQLTMLRLGVLVGYGNPRTLTNTYARPHGDLCEYKPKFFIGVPRIFDTIKKAVTAQLPAQGVKRAVFDRAFADRKEALMQGKDTPYYNEKVFKGPRELLGGKCVFVASGAAPLSAETQTFMEVVFGVTLVQGYGLTETCASTTLQVPFDTRRDCVGGLTSVAEIKLRDADDWKHTDQPNPRGEILIRGPTVAQGYFKQPQKTAEVFLPDGWFCTGDVGEFLPDGTLKIIGRTKALAKNLLGEYVALEALESMYSQNDLALPNGVCVIVNPQRAYIGAIVLTDEAKAMNFVKINGLKGEWPAVLATPEFQEKAIESFAKTADSFKRKPFEKIKTIRVLHDEWTPENGVLTAAMKLKRRVIDEKYKDLIAEMFTADA